MQFKCDQCMSVLTSSAVTDGMKVACPVCGAEIECHPVGDGPKHRKAAPESHEADGDGGLPGAIHAKMASAIGIENLKGFSLTDLFSEVFSKHTREEVEDYFTVGTSKSTPDILEIEAAWPKPWIFTRMMIASLVLYFLLLFGWNMWKNTNLLPGLMLVGSFAIPISTLVLFIELRGFVHSCGS